MTARGGFRLSVKTLSDSHRTAPYGFCGGFDCWVNHTRFNAQDGFPARATRLLSESSVRMEHIVRASTIFEVELVVVCSVSVFVVDVVKEEGVGDEGFCYKSVNTLSKAFSGSAQTNREITAAVGIGGKDLARLVIPYSPIVRYAVRGETDDVFPCCHKMSLLTYIGVSPPTTLISHTEPFVKHYF